MPRQIFVPFTDEEIKTIKALAVGGKTLRQIARQFACSITPIKRVLDQAGITTLDKRNRRMLYGTVER